MTSVLVQSEIDYEVIVGGEWRSFLSAHQTSHKKILIVAPAFIADLVDLPQLTRNESVFLFVSPDGEGQKDYSTVEKIWNFLGQAEFGRTDAIIAIGGGATTDLVGFVAATWLRGIAWYAIPTTLAGMVDASVGGKTGINSSAGKNLVGSFYSPKAVCADISWLETLSDRDFSAGLAEVIKTGFIRDLSILQLLDGAVSVATARSLALALVLKSVTVKAAVVSIDFKEGKLREILNYGHTLGHAIEKKSDYSLRHGEAVAIGLHFASLLSERELGLDSGATVHLKELLHKFNLPSTIDSEKFQFSELLALMAGDKKSRDGRLRFVGIRAPGEPDWIEGVSASVLAETYEKITI